MSKKIFTASIILNGMFILATGSFVYHKWDKIQDKIAALGGGVAPSEKVLSTFNNEPLDALNDSLMTGDDSTTTVLFLGNSLTYTGVPEEEPNKTKRGLTSTAPSRDYVHQLVNRIAREHHINVKFSAINVADFERGFTQHTFPMSKLAHAKFLQPDILIVQIGENVSEEDIKDPLEFEEKYVSLLRLFPHSKRIITLPFWPSKQKQYAITNVAIRSNSYLVDISHLGDGTDPQNFASSQKKHYKLDGVAAHPGDVGMKHIADCYYAAINVMMTQK